MVGASSTKKNQQILSKHTLELEKTSAFPCWCNRADLPPHTGSAPGLEVESAQEATSG